MSFSALVLAGSRGGGDPLATYAGVPDKALIEIDGTTMLARVVAALREAGADRIHVSVSSEAVRRHAEALGTIPLQAAAGPSASTCEGLAYAGAPLLLTTADHALLRPEWVREFLDRVPDADVAALLAERSVVERDAPTTRRTWLRFADGHWSGCNMFWLATPAADAALALWSDVERDRKRPWRIVRRLGPGLLLRYLSGRLTLADAVAALGRRAGVKARIVASRHGLAAVDVDKPADLDLVRSLVEQGAA
ncbi:MobA-like NTP transferase domain-containing protein [Sphingomonas gellani]|uniref:MobA-like NTP transferase domain-containing protein n=1 Tax=Sphingomonas gellani TaxID=1166340 RepID=A0A1H8DTM3_9SPHN|nr:nucleotidyltransferase family protein [Sphingomonas gellani]SEN10570.1 MobA-like NTP transferase domain-containing protein [Sphingomonas gellani]